MIGPERGVRNNDGTDVLEWDSYTRVEEYAGHLMKRVYDPTSFRVVNRTTGECTDSFMALVASQAPCDSAMSQWFYCGIVPAPQAHS